MAGKFWLGLLLCYLMLHEPTAALKCYECADKKCETCLKAKSVDCSVIDCPSDGAQHCSTTWADGSVTNMACKADCDDTSDANLKCCNADKCNSPRRCHECTDTDSCAKCISEGSTCPIKVCGKGEDKCSTTKGDDGVVTGLGCGTDKGCEEDLCNLAALTAGGSRAQVALAAVAAVLLLLLV